MYRICLFIAALLLMQFNISAQSVKGAVKDSETGEELIGATVCLKENPRIGVSTGLDGSFTLAGVSRFPVELVCNYVGYEEKTVTAGSAASLAVSLKPETVRINEVTVIPRSRGHTVLPAKNSASTGR